MSRRARIILLALALVCLLPHAAGSAPARKAAPAAPENDALEPAAASMSDENLERMRREVQAMRRLAVEEAEKSAALLAGGREKLRAEHAALTARKAALESRVAELEARFAGQKTAIALLEGETAAQEADSRTLEGAVRLNAGLLLERAALVPYASLAPETVDNAAALARNTEYPDHARIAQLTESFFQELEHASAVSLREEEITLGNGGRAAASVLRVGGLTAVAGLNGEYGYLLPIEGGRALLLSEMGLSSAQSRQIRAYYNATGNFVPVDFSSGVVLRHIAQGETLFQHLEAGGALVWPILAVGISALIYGLWRLFRLYRVGAGDEHLLDEFFTAARAGDYTQAASLLQSGEKRKIPVYSLLLHMLDNWNGTVTSLEKCRDEGLFINLVPLERGVSYVAVAAAVAPLIGLLGTVTGMISTFDVITVFGNSDPKMLSGGISVALVTTELGLLAAVPLLFLHYLLTRRISDISDDLEQKGAVLIARASAQMNPPRPAARSGYEGSPACAS